jgi:hypothetical protein
MLDELYPLTILFLLAEHSNCLQKRRETNKLIENVCQIAPLVFFAFNIYPVYGADTACFG